MSHLLSTYMTCQVAQMRKILDNFHKEGCSILENDRTRMREVLQERRELLDGIHQLSDSISRQIEEQGETSLDPLVGQLNSEIETLTTEIDQCNKKNKLLLYMRVVKASC